MVRVVVVGQSVTIPPSPPLVTPLTQCPPSQTVTQVSSLLEYRSPRLTLKYTSTDDESSSSPLHKNHTHKDVEEVREEGSPPGSDPCLFSLWGGGGSTQRRTVTRTSYSCDSGTWGANCVCPKKGKRDFVFDRRRRVLA